RAAFEREHAQERCNADARADPDHAPKMLQAEGRESTERTIDVYFGTAKVRDGVEAPRTSFLPELGVVFSQGQRGDLLGKVANLADGDPQVLLNGRRRDREWVQLPLLALEAWNGDEDEGPGLVHHPPLQRTHDKVHGLCAAWHHRFNLVSVSWPEPPEEQNAVGPGGRADHKEH